MDITDSNERPVVVLIDHENVVIAFRKTIKPREPIRWEAVLEAAAR